MGSYGFSHGSQLQCPLGEDSKQCAVAMGVFLNGDVNPYMPLDNRLDGRHDCSQNWNVVTRPLGYEMDVHFAMPSSSMLDHYLL